MAFLEKPICPFPQETKLGEKEDAGSRSDVFHFLSCGGACVHGACRTGWAAGFGFAEFSYGQCWKMLVCSFLFRPSPLLKFL